MAGTISQEVIAKVRTLPPMPVVSRKLVAAMQQDSCSTAEISKILSSDQALASQVLKLVNSSFYGLSGKVSTVSHAVVILGFSAVRSMAVGLGVAKAIQAASGENDQKTFWQHSIATGAAARILAEETGHPEPEEAFVAGLLHDLGALVMGLVIDPARYAEATRDAKDLVAAEDAAFGINHAKAGQHLLRHWRLPETLCHCVRFHHHPDAYRSDPSKLTAFVAAGDQFAVALGASTEPLAEATRLFDLATFLGLSLQRSGVLLTRIEQAILDTYVFLSLAGVDVTQVATGSDKGRRVVVLGGSAERTGWILGLLNRAGFQVVPLQVFLAQPAMAADLDLIVVDGASMSRENLQRLKPVLATPGAMITSYGEPSADLVATLGRPLPMLPAVFGPADLENVLGARILA
jgi:HD-like signal output (HDOD) protein